MWLYIHKPLYLTLVLVTYYLVSLNKWETFTKFSSRLRIYKLCHIEISESLGELGLSLVTPLSK